MLRFTIVVALLMPAALYAGSQDRYTVSPLPVQMERIAPVEVTQKEPGHLFIDFGQDSFAGLELTVPNPQPGQNLTVLLGESSPALKHSIPSPVARYAFSPPRSPSLTEPIPTAFHLPLPTSAG